MGRALAYIFLGLAVSSLALVFLVGSRGDAWICVQGNWTKHGNPHAQKPTVPCPVKGTVMKFESASFTPSAEMPTKYTCYGEGIAPSFAISLVPKNTKSLVLTLEDPDTKAGTFHHLVAWNIDPGVGEIVDGNLPEGSIVGVNSTGQAGYIPPCPPNGRHRYIFTLTALDKVLEIPTSANRNALDVAIAGHVLTKATLTGVYSAK